MTAPARIGRYEIVRRLGKSMTDVYLAIDTVENRKAALKLIQPAADRTTQLIMEAERRGAAIQKELRAHRPAHGRDLRFRRPGRLLLRRHAVRGRAQPGRGAGARSSTVDPHRAAVDRARNLRAARQVSFLALGRGARRHQALEHPPRARTTPCGCSISASPRRCAPSGDATAHQFGSPGYCSPERLTRSEVDQQSDLWAVGATLYEMLAGVPPFQAENTRSWSA